MSTTENAVNPAVETIATVSAVSPAPGSRVASAMTPRFSMCSDSIIVFPIPASRGRGV